MVDIKVITNYDDFTDYFDDYSVMLADYFLWNIQSRYDFQPELFEKNAARMNTSLDDLLEEFRVMKKDQKMSDRQLRRLQDQFASGQCFLLLYDGSNLIGMTRLYHRDNNEAELHSVYVDPSHRGNNYGSMLLDKVISIARDEGFEVIYLDTMPFMEGAIKLYESKNFEYVNYIDFPAYTRERAKDIGVIFMQLDLMK